MVVIFTAVVCAAALSPSTRVRERRGTPFAASGRRAGRGAAATGVHGTAAHAAKDTMTTGVGSDQGRWQGDGGCS